MEMFCLASPFSWDYNNLFLKLVQIWNFSLRLFKQLSASLISFLEVNTNTSSECTLKKDIIYSHQVLNTYYTRCVLSIIQTQYHLTLRATTWSCYYSPHFIKRKLGFKEDKQFDQNSQLCFLALLLSPLLPLLCSPSPYLLSFLTLTSLALAHSTQPLCGLLSALKLAFPNPQFNLGSCRLPTKMEA